MNSITLELLEKAKETKSVEELLCLAKENNIDLTPEMAEDYYAQLHISYNELDDYELDNVTGGGCIGKKANPDWDPECPDIGSRVFLPATKNVKCYCEHAQKGMDSGAGFYGKIYYTRYSSVAYSLNYWNILCEQCHTFAVQGDSKPKYYGIYSV